ncbi:MAG: peptidylprolyl isomerase [Gemmatimonadaceae bacterium]
MKIRSIAIACALAGGLAGCDSLREALTTHVDVVAKAEDRELSVTRSGDLLGNTTLQIPINRETAMIVADLWMNYQLLGVAAARGDSLGDQQLIDDATVGITANERLRRYMASAGGSTVADSASETTYTQAAGGIMVARHILFQFPGGASQEQKDSVRRRAETIRAQVTSRNFADMARRHSTDGSAAQGGNLGAFRRDDMVKPFSDAVASLQPGEISGLVETQYGYHIIQRPTYADARAQYDPMFAEGAEQRAESVFVAGVEADADIEVRADAAAQAKAAARDLAAHRQNTDVMATYTGGRLTVSRFVRWVESFQPQARIPQQMAGAPDSLVRLFVRSIARNEVLLMKADSAGIVMTPAEKEQLYGEFRGLIVALWQQLGIDPLMLADSARNQPERERLAAARVDAYLDRMMTGQAQPLTVPSPVQSVLTATYSWKINSAGVDRAVERARKLRASADSARSAQQPPSQVPMPAPPGDTGRNQ